MSQPDVLLSKAVPLSAEATHGFMLTSTERAKIYMYIFTAIQLSVADTEQEIKRLQTKRDRVVKGLHKNPKDKNTITALLRKTDALLERDITSRRK